MKLIFSTNILKNTEIINQIIIYMEKMTVKREFLTLINNNCDSIFAQ